MKKYVKGKKKFKEHELPGVRYYEDDWFRKLREYNS